MKIVNSEEMINIDKASIEEYSIPSIILMENAGRSIFEKIRKHIKKENNIVVICGAGNNGGDGLVVARNLLDEGYGVYVLISKKDGTKDYNTNLQILLKRYDEKVFTFDESKSLTVIEKSEVIIDAIFGTGLSRKIDGTYAEIINRVNLSQAKVFSVDIPSGLSFVKDGGQCIKADKTFTVSLPKEDFFTLTNAPFVGKIYICKTVFPPCLFEVETAKMRLLDESECLDIKPLIKNKDGIFKDKRKQGRLLIIAGSLAYTGAPVMCAYSAYRSGVGYTTLFCPSLSGGNISKNLPPEIVLREGSKNYFTKEDVEKALALSKKSDSVLIGCGIGREEETREFVYEFISAYKGKLVIDADAISILTDNVSIINGRENSTVLTPHTYEASSLFGISPKEIENNPYDSLIDFTDKHKVSVLLKDALSYFKSYNSPLYVWNKPKEGMGKAGMGDTLAGVIAAFLARGFNASQATRFSLLLINEAFYLIKTKMPSISIQPSDLSNFLALAYKKTVKKILGV